MAAKHTPGPWEITEDLGMDEAWCNWHRVGPVDLMGSTANANSRLIAAAPDMLEALKAVHACGNAGAKLSRVASDKTRAAIAKAEGR